MAGFRAAFVGASLALFSGGAFAQTFVVEERVVVDYRPVVARVEAGDTATARSRLQGIVSQLSIDEGQVVKKGELVAVVKDDTIGPQISALDARVAGLRSQVAQLQSDLGRAETLFKQGFYAQARLDELKTNLDIAQRTLASVEAERRSLSARQAEGQIRAPADARVTGVNVVKGSIVSPGEVIASFATLDGVIRLSLPERHASQLTEGETVTIRMPTRDGAIGHARIEKIYPELRDGALIADAVMQNGLSALVGERVDVLAAVGERRAIRIPSEYVSTRFGIDFVRVKVGENFIDAPVALADPVADAEGEVEVLTGLKPGDVIELPRGAGHES